MRRSLFFLAILSLFVLLFSIYLQKEMGAFYSIANLGQDLMPKNKVLPQKEIILIFVGDIMLDRGVKYMIEKYGQQDYKFPFLKITPHLKDADLLFGNLEGPISDKGRKVGSIYSFRMKPEAIEGLKFSGFDLLSLANNHIFDYGKLAFEDSLIRLKMAGIDYVGAGFNEMEAYSGVIKQVNKTKIGFLALTNLGSESWAAKENNSGIAWLTKESLKKSLARIRNQADLLFVSFHYGDEYKKESNDFQREISHFAIDQGADLVVGHHPHVVQPIEQYRGKYIVYSLGNFVFDQNFSDQTRRGLLLKVIIKDKKIKEVVPIEIKINQYFQPEIVKE